MEIKVRFKKNGEFHAGDLNRLTGKDIVRVNLPYDPMHGPAIVVVEKLSDQNVSSPATDFQSRPSTFHP